MDHTPTLCGNGRFRGDARRQPGERGARLDDVAEVDARVAERLVDVGLNVRDGIALPREHDEETRAALLAAAEAIAAEKGPAALSVRAVAEAAGTTTRAVYTLFGSKDGLLVQALARDAFEFLHTEIEKLPETDDPASDLIDVGLLVVRRLVRDHPTLYRIAFQRIVPGLEAGPELVATRERAWEQLVAKVERLRPLGLLGGKPTPEAAVEFIAMTDGLGSAELRGAVLRLLPEGSEEEAWRTALTSLIRGWSAP